jgi:hypothetical protein
VRIKACAHHAHGERKTLAGSAAFIGARETGSPAARNRP